MQSRGKKLTLLFATLAVVVLGVAGWIGWPWVQFWQRFESLGLNAQGFSEYRHRNTGIIMVRLPGGTFWMGAQKEDPEGRNYDWHAGEPHGPVHQVTLSPFLIGKFEVTQFQWEQVMEENPSFFGPDGRGAHRVPPEVNRDSLPVEDVSWEMIQPFEEKTGLLLPTEAQWEYACRAGTQTTFSFGSDKDCPWGDDFCDKRDTFMWGKANAEERTHEVGTKPANPFGLHDMHGNVWEWCEDVCDRFFYSKLEAAGPNPVCTSGSQHRVYRGGGWCCYPYLCRSANRNSDRPSERVGYLAFRPAAPCP